MRVEKISEQFKFGNIPSLSQGNQIWMRDHCLSFVQAAGVTTGITVLQGMQRDGLIARSIESPLVLVSTRNACPICPVLATYLAIHRSENITYIVLR